MQRSNTNMKIEPLNGLVICTPCAPMRSIDVEIASAKGLGEFVVVDNKAGRSDTATGRTRVRLFNIVKANENDAESLAFVGKRMYCVCFENELENNIVVDENNGDKLFIIPTSNIIAEYKVN